jgi:magnesium transporter
MKLASVAKGLTRLPFFLSPPGAAAGLEAEGLDLTRAPDPGAVRIRRIDYGPDVHRVSSWDGWSEAVLEPPPEGAQVTWYDVEGLHPFVLQQFRSQLGIHTLSAEDVLVPRQRPRLEEFDQYVVLFLHMLRDVDDGLDREQVSLFLFPHAVVSFQERAGDAWSLLRRRLERPGSRIRQRKADFLLYALVDAVVDHYFPVIEHHARAIDGCEQAILNEANTEVLGTLQRIRREVGELRRVVGPLRLAMTALLANEAVRLAKPTRSFVRDVVTHLGHAADLVDDAWNAAGGLVELQSSLMANRTNEVMKVLTVTASVFIPLTFLAGVYGMNFEHMPELAQWWAYPAFWAASSAIALALGTLFWSWGWLTPRRS